MKIAISVCFILSYVAAEDDGKSTECKQYHTPPFSMNRFSGMMILGYSWIFNHLLIPLAAALGFWTVRNIGRERGSLKWPLIGASVAYLLMYYTYDESICFMAMTITSSLLFDSFSKQWDRQPKKSHILRWMDLKQCLIETYNFAQHHGWYEVWKQTIDLSDPHGEQNAYKVLGLSQDSSQQEITSTWRRLSREFHPDKVKEDSQRRAAQERFMEIQQAYELLSNSKSRRNRNNKKDLPTDTWDTTTPGTIPSQEKNVQEPGVSTPTSTTIHNINVPLNVFDQSCNRSSHFDVEPDRIDQYRDRDSSTSSSIFDLSTDHSDNKNVVEAFVNNQTGNRKYMVKGNRSLLDQTVNYSLHTYALVLCFLLLQQPVHAFDNTSAESLYAGENPVHGQILRLRPGANYEETIMKMTDQVIQNIFGYDLIVPSPSPIAQDPNQSLTIPKNKRNRFQLSKNKKKLLNTLLQKRENQRLFMSFLETWFEYAFMPNDYNYNSLFTMIKIVTSDTFAENRTKYTHANPPAYVAELKNSIMIRGISATQKKFVNQFKSTANRPLWLTSEPIIVDVTLISPCEGDQFTILGMARQYLHGYVYKSGKNAIKQIIFRLNVIVLNCQIYKQQQTELAVVSINAMCGLDLSLPVDTCPPLIIITKPREDSFWTIILIILHFSTSIFEAFLVMYLMLLILSCYYNIDVRRLY